MGTMAVQNLENSYIKSFWYQQKINWSRCEKKNESRTAFFSEKLWKKLEINIVGENMHILSEMIYKTVSDTQ